MSKQPSCPACILFIYFYELRAFPVIAWRPLAILTELQPHRSALRASARRDSPDTVQYHFTRWHTAAADNCYKVILQLLHAALQRGVSDILMGFEVRQVLQRWGECSLVFLFQLPVLTASRLKRPDIVELDTIDPTQHNAPAKPSHFNKSGSGQEASGCSEPVIRSAFADLPSRMS